MWRTTALLIRLRWDFRRLDIGALQQRRRLLAYKGSTGFRNMAERENLLIAEFNLSRVRSHLIPGKLCLLIIFCCLGPTVAAQTNSVVTVETNLALVINGRKVFPI